MTTDARGERRPIRVLCWSERTEPAAVYPHGINGAIADALEAAGGFEPRAVDLGDEGQGLDDLDWADVLVWFGHLKHRDVTAENVQRIVDGVRVRGLGYVPVHSSLDAPPFHQVIGHRGGSAGWREDGCPSVVNVVQPDHPIALGIDRPFVIPMEEMYAEPFAIKPPDELVFISSFAGGEVLRSGCCWYAGAGRVFYFQPGHETYPVYFQREIRQIMANACRWAAARLPEEGAGGRVLQGAPVPGDPRRQRQAVSQAELQARVGSVAGAPAVDPDTLRGLIETFRGASREARGGMDSYIRVRAAARADACGRVADELERVTREGARERNGDLLALAAQLRARSVDGDVPPDVKLPTLWRADRSVPALDPSRVQREQQIGFALGLAQCAAQIHLAAGGTV